MEEDLVFQVRYKLISINLRTEKRGKFKFTDLHLINKFTLTDFFGRNIPDVSLSLFGTYTSIILWGDEFGLIIKGI